MAKYIEVQLQKLGTTLPTLKFNNNSDAPCALYQPSSGAYLLLYNSYRQHEENSVVLDEEFARLNGITSGVFEVRQVERADKAELRTTEESYLYILNNQEACSVLLGQMRLLWKGGKFPVNIKGRVCILESVSQGCLYLADDCDLTILPFPKSPSASESFAARLQIRPDCPRTVFCGKGNVVKGQLLRVCFRRPIRLDQLKSYSDFDPQQGQTIDQSMLTFIQQVEPSPAPPVLRLCGPPFAIQAATVTTQPTLSKQQCMLTQTSLNDIFFDVQVQRQLKLLRQTVIDEVTKAVHSRFSSDGILSRLNIEIDSSAVIVAFRGVTLVIKQQIKLDKKIPLSRLRSAVSNKATVSYTAPKPTLTRVQSVFAQQYVRGVQVSQAILQTKTDFIGELLANYLPGFVVDFQGLVNKSKLNVDKAASFLDLVLKLAVLQAKTVVFKGLDKISMPENDAVNVLVNRFKKSLKRHKCSRVVLAASSSSIPAAVLPYFRVARVREQVLGAELLRKIGLSHSQDLLIQIFKHDSAEHYINFLKAWQQRQFSTDFLKKFTQLRAQTETKYPLLSDVYGLKQAKLELNRVFLTPLKHGQLFAKSPIKLSKAALLKGSSGSGKTFLAKALVNSLGIDCIEVRGPELLDKYIGASEEAVRKLFERAMARAPCMLVFQQFQSIATARTAGSTSATDRVINQMLCYLDGVSDLPGVFILAISSRPEMIDPALLRSGRIDRHITLGLPSLEQRTQLIDAYTRDLVLQSLTVQEMAGQTDGLSFAEVSGLFKEIRIAMAHNPQFKFGTSALRLDQQLWQSVLARNKLSLVAEQQSNQQRQILY